MTFARLLYLLPRDRPAIFGHVGFASCHNRPPVRHAHGGTGIVINRLAFSALVSCGIPRPLHHRHSDVSLALWVDALNSQCGVKRPIEWAHLHDMHLADEPFDSFDIREAVSVHVKDRESFARLYERIGVADYRLVGKS